MEGNNVIRRHGRIKVKKALDDQETVEAIVERVHGDTRHIDVRYGPLGLKHMTYVPIGYVVEVLE